MADIAATSADDGSFRLQIFKQITDSLVDGRTPFVFEEGTKNMARTRVGAHRIEPKAIGVIAREEILAENFEEYAEQIEDTLDEDTDFDAEDDIAFLAEEYDVLELDDVLELCNLEKRDPFRN